jgi:hypothetical protein
LWIASAQPGPHIRVVTGMVGDGPPKGTIVYINDLWQKVWQLLFFQILSQYTETYEEFEEKKHSLAISAKNIEGAIYVAHLSYDSLKVFK